MSPEKIVGLISATIALLIGIFLPIFAFISENLKLVILFTEIIVPEYAILLMLLAILCYMEEILSRMPKTKSKK